MNAKSEFAFGAEQEVASSRSPAVSLGSRQQAGGSRRQQAQESHQTSREMTPSRTAPSSDFTAPLAWKCARPFEPSSNGQI